MLPGRSGPGRGHSGLNDTLKINAMRYFFNQGNGVLAPAALLRKNSGRNARKAAFWKHGCFILQWVFIVEKWMSRVGKARPWATAAKENVSG